jgi:hypothetical protein
MGIVGLVLRSWRRGPGHPFPRHDDIAEHHVDAVIPDSWSAASASETRLTVPTPPEAARWRMFFGMSVIFEINRDFSYQAKTLHVHQPAVSVKTVRQCRAQGRLDPKRATHFVPRGDMRPAPPSCLSYDPIPCRAVRRDGAQYFRGRPVSRRRRNETVWPHCHPCHARRARGSPCYAPAKCQLARGLKARGRGFASRKLYA